jgi:uncharacterized Rmd1/YagE family protein
MDKNRILKQYARCAAYCTAASYNLVEMAAFFKKKGFLTHISRDVLHVMRLNKPGDIYFFNYGCFVIWGFKKVVEQKIISYVKDFSIQPLNNYETDYFYYHSGPETNIDAHDTLQIDVISLADDDIKIKLAISYGLAQSIKLEAFEEAVKLAIRKSHHLPEEIANQGIISLSRRAIFKRIGEIFLVRSSINLNIEYLAAPEFFWRNTNLEPYYIMAKQFLEIQNRVAALNQQLDVLQELLDILNSQVQHSHSSLLESIIIILIVVEIMISLFQFHLV